MSPSVPRYTLTKSVFCSCFLFFAALVLLSSCTDTEKKKEARIKEVTVLDLAPRQVELTAELSARVSAFRKAEVRPQVSGILKEQLFTEGSLVKEGQSLYKIDPASYAALVESAKAALASAEAKLSAARLRRERRAALLRDQAVSQQAFEDAEAEFLQAKADTDVARAALRTASINLRYTDVLAPITGRIGKSSVTRGALVTANQSDALAVIQQLDPVYVDMTQSSLDLIRLRERYETGALTRPDKSSVKVRLRLETHKPYPLEGELKFADISVDESTGMVLLRAVFPNPEGILLPGMFVRAEVKKGLLENALLVPQLAVDRDAKGNASVFILKEDQTVHRRVVQTSERVDRFWVVSEGLAPGDKIVVDGLQGLREGAKVRVRDMQKSGSTSPEKQ